MLVLSNTPYLGPLAFVLIEADIPPNSYSFDLYNAIRYTDIEEDLRKRLWDDGLHLTSEGYKVMGDVIAVRMLELLKMARQPKNIGPVTE